MKIFGKTISYWKEYYGGIISGIIISLLIFLLKPNISHWTEFIKEFSTIGMCAFGFLLTFLGIILQGDSEAILWMKSRKLLFKRFISYNKRIVKISLYLSICSYVFGFWDFELSNRIFNLTECNYAWIQQLLISLFGGVATWFVIDTICFINIFYLLIQED